MSFDIFLSVLPGSEEDRFARSLVERAFTGLTPKLIGDYWNLRTPGGEDCFANVSIDDEPEIDGFSVNRPPSFEAFPEFWNAMFEILHQTRTILFWPDDGPYPTYCIANPVLVTDPPPILIEIMGEPAIVSSGAEIDAAISRTGH